MWDKSDLLNCRYRTEIQTSQSQSGSRSGEDRLFFFSRFSQNVASTVLKYKPHNELVFRTGGRFAARVKNKVECGLDVLFAVCSGQQ